jgi:hypothetical protein
MKSVVSQDFSIRVAPITGPTQFGSGFALADQGGELSPSTMQQAEIRFFCDEIFQTALSRLRRELLGPSNRQCRGAPK